MWLAASRASPLSWTRENHSYLTVLLFSKSNCLYPSFLFGSLSKSIAYGGLELLSSAEKTHTFNAMHKPHREVKVKNLREIILVSKRVHLVSSSIRYSSPYQVFYGGYSGELSCE